MPRPLLLAACLLCGSGGLLAQDRAAVVLSGESRAAAGRIEAIQKNLDAKKWEAALAEIQNVLGSGGDELVSVGPNRAVQARLICHRLIAALPIESRTEVLRIYRARTEAQARKWLDLGLAERDPLMLRKVVDQAFCTRAAERALDALGDLAFERGRFDQAEAWWRTLKPLEAHPADLSFPDPAMDAARTHAKQLLARLFRSDPLWNETLAAYRKQHPDAAGKLAGREGRYADVLQAVAEGLKPGAGRDWPTFGGDPARGVLLSATAQQTDRLGALCRRPTWRFNLDTHVRDDEPAPPPQWDGRDRKSARSLAFFPVIVDDRVIVADARTVTAHNLRTGRSEDWFDAARLLPSIAPDLSLPSAPDLRYSLTLAGDCVLARLGTQEIRDVRTTKKEGDVESLLVCLDLEPGPHDRRPRWLARSSQRDVGMFEGCPVVQDGQVFVAATRCTADATVTAILCYALEAKGTPPLRWSRDICETRELQAGERRRRHHLLTLAGPNVVYCSHSGAIVALDAVTGRRAWSVRYPSAAPVPLELPGIDRPRFSDLTPCLYAAGRLYAAPSDSDRLLCLDPITGRTYWERKVSEIVHLLGVSRGRLIITTGSGLRALNAATGADLWTAPDIGELPPMGRGLLLGDLVLWPTTRGVLLVRQEDGRLAEDPGFLHSVPKGNLAFAHGCLLVADRSTLTVFVPPAQQLEERRRDAERDPDSAEAVLELGLAEADAGLFDAAVKSLETAERLAKHEPALRDEARRARHATLMTAGKYELAAGGEFTAEERVRAVRRRAEEREKMDAPKDAVEAWQVFLEDTELRGVRVTGANGLPRTAGQLATERIAGLLKKHGQKTYAAVEQRARAMFDAVPKGNTRADALERLTVEFPHAEVRRVILRELLELYTKSSHHSGVYHTCSRLWANPGPKENINELSARIWNARSGTLTKFPAVPPPLPLLRSWSLNLEPEEFVLVSRNSLTVTRQSLVLPPFPSLVLYTSLPSAAPSGGGWLRCREDKRGEVIWQTKLPFVPEWLDCDLHVLVLGSSQGVAAIRPDGHLLWTFPAQASCFRYEDDRLFFLENGRLLAVDVPTGQVEWQREALGADFLPMFGRFHTHYYANRWSVLIQTTSGRRWLLQALTGRTLHDAPTSSEPWPNLPSWLSDDRLLFVADRQIVVLDRNTSREVWSTTANAPSAITGEPLRVLARNKTILVIIQTNLGTRLQRLDHATGKPLWPSMPLLSTDRFAPSNWSLDEEDDTVYRAQGQNLIALSLSDGKPRWRTNLTGPTGLWGVHRWGDYLLVYPAQVAEWRFQFRSPFGAVQWGIALAPEERPGSGCPLLALDPATGKIVQRWNFPAGSLRLRSYPAEASMWPVVEIAQRVGDAGMTVISTSGGLVVTIGARVWGLRTN